MSRTLTALGLVLSGCLALAKAVVCQKALWLLVGAPAVALGLWLADLRLDPVAGLRALSRWIQKRADDLEILLGMLRDAPGEFRLRRETRG